MVLGLIIVLLVCLVISRTMLGKAMTAVAKSPDIAAVSGLQVSQIVILGWVIAGGTMAVAGGLLSLISPVSSASAIPLAINGFAGSVIGGVDNPGRAALGAIGLSLLDTVFTRYVSPAYSDIFVFSVLFVVLAIRPGGFRIATGERLA
jgi:branched-subunit amino acid ABC-type transport system permease component